ncbi:hypothetical protein OOK36_49530 [Streptomyces sp. NBC_00365]|uniref:hypothetical protein n=1 Tax=Streptomyces sp. NBC_00365 TaxID=2975726 RepID=UPI0022573A5D|nr:hypothetical protein [Streptomyces sp. NBC_00365]MCX5096625.1 hypothetical protein [Streptomyces sp. NBC_00365]
MSLHLSTDDWVAIAGVSTIINMVALRWCMPTPKAKRQISFLPLGGSVLLVSSAVAEGYSASFTLYLYSCILLTFVVILAPVGKRVAADILEQEQKPWDKVPLNTFSLYWVAFSSTGCIVAMLYIWPAIN